MYTQEDYLEDYVATCKWPTGMAGNWAQASQLQGRLRLCTRSLFFEPDDVRVPIARSGTVLYGIECTAWS